MKELKLIIKQQWFDAILSGEKTEEYREVKPTTFKKYLNYVVAGELFSDLSEVPNEKKYTDDLKENGFDVELIQYDALRLYVGYNKDRDSMLVEVKDAILTNLVDENDEPIYYEYKGNEYIMQEVTYVLGKILEVNKK